MWPFKRVPRPSPKRLIELEDEISDVKVALAWCKKAIIELNARMATVIRQSAVKKDSLPDNDLGDVDSGRHDDPNAGRPRPTTFPTSHLSRRFRGF